MYLVQVVDIKTQVTRWLRASGYPDKTEFVTDPKDATEFGFEVANKWVHWLGKDMSHRARIVWG